MNCVGKNLPRSIYDNEVGLSSFQISAGLQWWLSGSKSESRRKGRSPCYSDLCDNELKVVYIWLSTSI